MDYSRIFLVFCLSLWNIVESAPVNLQSVILQNECVFPPRYLATGLQHTSDLDPCNAPIGILKTICSNITLESSCPLPKITMPSVEVTLNMYNNKQPKSDYVEQMCMYMNNLPWTLDENCTQICGEAFYVCDLYIAMDKALRNLFEKEVQADYTKIDAFIHPGQLNHLYPYPPMSSLHIPTMLDCCLKHDEATKQLCTVMAEVARMYVKTRVAVELDESHFIRNVSADWNPCSDFSSYISFSSSIDFQTLLRNCDVLCSTDMGICKMVYLGLEELSKATANRTNAAEQPSKVIGPEYQPSVDAGSPTGGGPAVVDTGNLTGGGPAVVNTGSLTGGGPAVEDTGSLTGEGPAVEAHRTNAAEQPSKVIGPEYQPSVDAGSPTGGGPAVVDTGSLTGGGPAVVNTGSLTGGGPAVVDTGSLTGGGPAVEDTGSLTGGGPAVVDTGSLTGGGPAVVNTGSLTGGGPAVVDTGSLTGGGPAVVDTGSLTGGGPAVVNTGSLTGGGPAVVDTGSLTGGEPAVVNTGSLTGGGPAVVDTGSLTGGGPAVEDTGSLTGEGPAVGADATNVIETNASQQPSQVLGLGPTDANGINTPETGAVVGSPATHTGSHTYLPTGALVGIPGTSLADLPILGNGEPTSAGEPTDTGVGNGEPTDTGVGNGEPTDTGVVNGEPTDTGVVNGETTSTVVGNGETTDTGVVNGEPTDPTVVNGGPTDTSVVNGEPTSTGVVNGGPTNTGVVNVEPASTDVGNGDSTGIVGNVEQPGSSIETPVGQNTSTAPPETSPADWYNYEEFYTDDDYDMGNLFRPPPPKQIDDDVVETAGNQQNEPGQTNQGVRGPAKAVYVGDDEGSDGHFMAYFLVFIVLSIAGYILFHNKQKIVALVIEGNGVKNGRRPNTNEYRQLKTEDVMPSLEKTTYSKDYVF